MVYVCRRKEVVGILRKGSCATISLTTTVNLRVFREGDSAVTSIQCTARSHRAVTLGDIRALHNVIVLNLRP